MNIPLHPLVERSVERHHLYVDPLLLDTEGRVIARLFDLSQKGCLIFTKNPITVGTKLEGWIDAPELVEKPETFVAVTMVVRWVSVDQRGWHRAGCEFDYDANDADEVQRLLEIIELLHRDPQ